MRFSRGGAIFKNLQMTKLETLTLTVLMSPAVYTASEFMSLKMTQSEARQLNKAICQLDQLLSN